MAGEATGTEETKVPEAMTGDDDGLNVNDAVAGIAESLKLVDDESQAAAPDGQSTTEGQEAETKDEKPVAADSATAEAATGVTTPAKPLTDGDRAPDTWRKEAQEKWATVDPAVKAEIAKREADVSKFVSEAQPSFNIAKGLQKTLEPYVGLFQRYNIDPMQHIGALLNAQTTLLFGQPEQKAQMFRNMAKQSGIDLAALANDANSTAQADTQQLAYIRAMEERIARMEQGMTGVTSQFQKAQEAELEQGIMAFAGDTEKHPFFWELAESGEIKALIDSGAARTLNDAYELALYRNPTTRAKQLELEGKRTADAAAKQATEKAVLARKATRANVKSRGAGRTPPVEESIDDTLSETMKEIRSRS